MANLSVDYSIPPSAPSPGLSHATSVESLSSKCSTERTSIYSCPEKDIEDQDAEAKSSSANNGVLLEKTTPTPVVAPPKRSDTNTSTISEPVPLRSSAVPPVVLRFSSPPPVEIDEPSEAEIASEIPLPRSPTSQSPAESRSSSPSAIYPMILSRPATPVTTEKQEQTEQEDQKTEIPEKPEGSEESEESEQPEEPEPEPEPEPVQPDIPNPFGETVSRAAKLWKHRKLVKNESNSVIDEVMKLQGLEDVKMTFLKILDKVNICKRQGRSLNRERFNIVFQGNPGTGMYCVTFIFPLQLKRSCVSSTITDTNSIRKQVKQQSHASMRNSYTPWV